MSLRFSAALFRSAHSARRPAIVPRDLSLLDHHTGRRIAGRVASHFSGPLDARHSERTPNRTRQHPPRTQTAQQTPCVWGVRRGSDAQADMPLAEAAGAICVQRFDDSRNSAIHTTYRISLRSSSLQEPRYPLLRVVFCYQVRV